MVAGSTHARLEVENCLYFCEIFAILNMTVMCIKFTNYTYSLQYKRSAGLYIMVLIELKGFRIG